MKFKVGEKVIDGFGTKGKIQEVLRNGCFINYGESAVFWYNKYITKFKRLPTLNKAFRDAEREKAEQETIEKMIEIFCENLSVI